MLYEMSAAVRRDSMVCHEHTGHSLLYTDGFVFYHYHRLIEQAVTLWLITKETVIPGHVA